MGSAATVFSGWMHTGRMWLAALVVVGWCVWCMRGVAVLQAKVVVLCGLVFVWGVCWCAVGCLGQHCVCFLVACVLLVVLLGCWWCVGVVCENWIVDASMTDAVLLLLVVVVVWCWCVISFFFVVF